MAKALFRFLRGELNGYYITNMYNTLNLATKDIKKFFVDFSNMQFNTDMPSEYIYGLGKFAGIYLLRLSKKEISSSIKLSESHEVDDVEYSERGLYNLDTEQMEYKNTTPDATGDINELSTERLRSSMVGDEEIQGFVDSTEEDVISEEGIVNPDYIKQEVPTGVAFNNFYGNNFMFLSESALDFETLASSLFLELYKAMQWIRYNGVSIASLCRIVSIICPDGLVKIEKIKPSVAGRMIAVYYKYNGNIETDLKQQRLSLLLFIISTKFTRINFVENV